MESLHGQVAIVTGAARGIGLGIATVLRDEGADVVLADLDAGGARLAATQLCGSGEHATSVGVDVTARSDMARMAAEAVGRFRRIDTWRPTQASTRRSRLPIFRSPILTR